MTLEEIQADMVGMSDADLLALAPTATHQHFKGGLYQLIGPAMDADTGKQLETPNEWLAEQDKYVGYLHLYPHERQLWIRREKEFFGPQGNGKRFRELVKS